MQARFALFAFLVIGPLTQAAELRTLTGESYTGDLISLSDKEIVFKVEKKEVITPIAQVLYLNFQSAAPKSDAKFSEVELNDGSQLRCKAVSFKGKEIKLTLLGGQELTLPIAAVSYVFHEANDAALHQEWQKMFSGKKRNRDVVVRKTGEKLTSISGTLGDADDKGENMAFESETSRKIDVPLAKIQGLHFQRRVDPDAKPPLFKLTDTLGNALLVSSASFADKSLNATTPSGAKIAVSLPQIIKLDYSKGKLTYLSDFGPDKTKIVHDSTFGVFEPVYRDMNLNHKAIKLGRKSYPKGLAIHAYTEITFDLEGEYREFKATIGIDDDVAARDDGTIVKIVGDGKELLSTTVTSKDKPQEKALNVKDVQKLTIIVASPNAIDMSRHVDLADAKVSK
ncbi:MAG: NPCBM/NEW2 domain-containing protein [Gemmataceae bacterium]